MLDVNQLSEEGFLRSGCANARRLIVGNEVLSINIRAEAERLHLSYAVRVGDGEVQNMAESIPIAYLPCRFGGNRPFFICPNCGQRTIKLYLSRRYFLCRRCNELRAGSGNLNRAISGVSA